MTMRRIGAGRSARGTPTRRRGSRLRPLSLFVLALLGLAQTGCQSGFFGPCGAKPCGSGLIMGPCQFMKGLRERVFHRGTYAAPMAVGVIGDTGCCGGSPPLSGPVVGEGPLEYAPPSIVTPLPGATPVLPSGPIESNPTGPTGLDPIPPSGGERERVPSAQPDSPLSSTPKSSAGRTQYSATQPRNQLTSATVGPRHAPQTVVSTPEPASRSAQGVTPSTESWLENLPPLTIPRETANNELPEPAPLALDAIRTKAFKPAPTSSTPLPDAVPASTEVSSKAHDATSGSTHVAPGIARFVSLEPKLSGGSLPTAEGLDWLAQKGYKTVLDLSEASEVQSKFIDEVANRGLRYVSLPMGLTKLDAEHVERFNREIQLDDSLPVYFCDADGVRAGALWYVRKVSVDGVDDQSAMKQAVELGLTDDSLRKAAEDYLKAGKPIKPESETSKDSELQPPPNTPIENLPASEPAPVEGNNDPTTLIELPLVPAIAVSLPALSPPPEEEEKVAVAIPDLPQSVRKPVAVNTPAPSSSLVVQNEVAPSARHSKEKTVQDFSILKSYASLVVTGFGVPLTYWSQGSLPTIKVLAQAQAQASQPATAQTARSIPDVSGE